jgi:hypothetical protein
MKMPYEITSAAGGCRVLLAFITQWPPPLSSVVEDAEGVRG